MLDPRLTQTKHFSLPRNAPKKRRLRHRIVRYFPRTDLLTSGVRSIGNVFPNRGRGVVPKRIQKITGKQAREGEGEGMVGKGMEDTAATFPCSFSLITEQ